MVSIGDLVNSQLSEVQLDKKVRKTVSLPALASILPPSLARSSAHQRTCSLPDPYFPSPWTLIDESLPAFVPPPQSSAQQHSPYQQHIAPRSPVQASTKASFSFSPSPKPRGNATSPSSEPPLDRIEENASKPSDGQCVTISQGRSNISLSHRHPTRRTFECDLCPSKFSRSHDLSRHRLTHTRERPFVCERCGRRFARRDALRRHDKVDPVTGQKVCAAEGRPKGSGGKKKAGKETTSEHTGE